MAGVAPVEPKKQFCDALGVPMAGGSVDVYLAGTTTRTTTWQDKTQLSANTNPIVLDSRGECVMWVDDSLTYKFVLKNAAGVTQWTVDNVIGGAANLSQMSFLQEGVGAVIRTAQDKMREALSPEDFEARGDGATDDTAALNKWAVALAAQNKPGVCRNASYRISQASLGVVFSGLRGCVIDFNGATFKVLDGDLVANSQAGFYFTDNEDCEFRNFILDGNRDNRTTAGEAGSHSVHIGPDNLRLKFVRCRSVNAVVDAWYARGTPATLSTYPTDISLIDCEGINAYRNGLSVIGSVRFKVHGGRYNEANGVGPQAGIDFEPNAADVHSNTDLEIIDVEASDNVGDGVSIGGDYENSGYIRNLRGSGNGDALLALSRVNSVVAETITAGDHPTVTRGVVDVAAAAVNVTVRNVKTNSNTATIAGAEAVVYVHSSATKVSVKGIEARNISIPAFIGNADGMAVEDILAEDCTASGFAVYVGPTADKARLRNIRTYRTAGPGVVVEGTSPELDGIYCEDSDSTVSALRLTSTATGGFVRGVHVHETTSIPVGANAVRIDAAPAEINGLIATGGYTDANTLFGTSTLFAATKVSNVHPDCFARSFTYDPASLASGAASTTTSTLAKANVGDACIVHAPYDLQGIIASASVSAASQVRLSLFNPTGGAIDLASATWVISLKKS